MINPTETCSSLLRLGATAGKGRLLECRAAQVSTGNPAYAGRYEVTDLTGHRVRLLRDPQSPRLLVTEQASPFLVRLEDGQVAPLGKWVVAGTGHEAQEVRSPSGEVVAIDSELLPLLQQLWAANVATRYSCQGGEQVEAFALPYYPRVRFAWEGEEWWTAYPFQVWDRPAYIAFSTAADRERAMELLGPEREFVEVSEFILRWHEPKSVA